MHWFYILFYSGYLSAVLSLSDIKYSNQWSVQINGGKEEADRLARKHGFLNEGKVGNKLNEMVIVFFFLRLRFSS